MKIKMFSYNNKSTPIHNLSGLTKLVSFLLISFAVMFSYDVRLILSVLLFSLVVLNMADIKLKQIRLMLIYVFIFLLTNMAITYLFTPEYGVKIYGTRHLVFNIIGRFTITLEELTYLVTKFFKYLSVVPFGIIFLLTTNPSEFASSLNSIGCNYKIAYSVALTLRYFPDMQRDYESISHTQQARGLEMSRKAGFLNRFKNALLIIVPLIFSTVERVEYISNAMDLRGFGKHKKRTWYSKKKLVVQDYVAIFISLIFLVASISLSLFVNGSRFYNPFI